MMIELYTQTNGLKAYLYIVGPKICDHCRMDLEQGAIYLTQWRQTGPTNYAFCFKCFKEYRPPPTPVESWALVQVVERIPPSCTPVINVIPSFRVGTISVYDAANQEFNKDLYSDASDHETEDCTVFAHNEPLCDPGRTLIGASQAEKHCEMMDAPLDAIELGLRVINDFAKSPPALPQKPPTKRLSRVQSPKIPQAR